MSALTLQIAAVLTLASPAAPPVDVPAPELDETIVEAPEPAAPPVAPPPESPEVVVTLPPCRPGIADPRCPGDGALPVDGNVTTNQLDPNVWAPTPVVPALYR